MNTRSSFGSSEEEEGRVKSSQNSSVARGSPRAASFLLAINDKLEGIMA